MKKVVLASNNKGKLREFSAALNAVGIEMIAQGELGVTEAQEPFNTFVENALAKARHASKTTGLPALADDSGISVPVLNGAPGVHSARYAALPDGTKSDQANNQKLVENLANKNDKTAMYVAVLVFVRAADDPRPIIVEGTWRGEIIDNPLGENGFGYDPHFYLPDLNKTAAQLSLEEKNSISHRAKALKKLLVSLKEENLI